MGDAWAGDRGGCCKDDVHLVVVVLSTGTSVEATLVERPPRWPLAGDPAHRPGLLAFSVCLVTRLF